MDVTIAVIENFHYEKKLPLLKYLPAYCQMLFLHSFKLLKRIKSNVDVLRYTSPVTICNQWMHFINIESTKTTSYSYFLKETLTSKVLRRFSSHSKLLNKSRLYIKFTSRAARPEPSLGNSSIPDCDCFCAKNGLRRPGRVCASVKSCTNINCTVQID